MIAQNAFSAGGPFFCQATMSAITSMPMCSAAIVTCPRVDFGRAKSGITSLPRRVRQSSLPPLGYAVNDLLGLRGVGHVIEVGRQLQMTVVADDASIQRFHGTVVTLIAQAIAEPSDSAA